MQFTDNLGTAVSKGFDVQAELALGYGVSLEFSLGYTNSRFTETLSKEPGAPALAAKGDGVPGEAGINYAPGLTPPWTIALGPQYDFNVAGYKSFVRADWEYTSRNPYLSPDQDPNAAAQYNSGYSYTLPYTSFVSLRSGSPSRISKSRLFATTYLTAARSSIIRSDTRSEQPGDYAAGKSLYVPTADGRLDVHLSSLNLKTQATSRQAPPRDARQDRSRDPE